MNLGILLSAILIFTTNLTITEPVDGETYDGDWLSVRAIVENDNEMADSVHYSLNGEPVLEIPRLNTDWYTYMQNDLHHGYSESPAPTDNTILWTAPITGTEHEFPTPVVVDGLVYYPQNEGGDTLFALDAATGEVEWIFTGTGSTDDAVTVKDGRLYTASDSIWCLDALTGARIWAFGDANWTGSTPVVSDGKVYCARRYSESRIYCLDANTGIELWFSEVQGNTVSCMTVWQDMLFVPTYKYSQYDGLLHALDAGTGDVIWENDDSYQGYWDSSPTVVDEVIYIGGYDGYLRAIDANSGETIWETDFGDGITATPAYHAGSLYIGSNYPPFASVNALNGFFNWTSDFTIHGSPGIADGTVFFGENSFNDSARVIALDCVLGDTIWTYMTTATVFDGSPAITDGIVYIPAIDGNLYAFGTGLKYTYLDDLYADIGSNELIVTAFDEGIAFAADTVNFTVTETGIGPEPSQRLKLCASPNPFRSSTSISLELSEPGYTSIMVFDLAGRIVRSMAESELGAGKHSYIWDGTNQSGEPVASGLYICRIQSGEISETTNLCLLR
ncbi:MAG: PQQ-binding-like beta-propeller repeat protein [Candidatus Aegiribacteria sp.]|nr:PQQ-binding-like beta-propeller repeat protein [Candidatus Aegiribacteria sp.]